METDNSELLSIVTRAIPLREGEAEMKADILRRVWLMEEIKKCVAKRLENLFNAKVLNKIALISIPLEGCAFKRAQNLHKREWLMEEIEKYVNKQLEKQFNAKEAV